VGPHLTYLIGSHRYQIKLFLFL